MNKWLLYLVLLFFVLTCTNLLWGLSNNLLETPKYSLIKKAGPYEVRVYEPMIIARTKVQSNYKKATSAGFRIIANYIFGGNKDNISIAMTAPVLTNSPVDVGGHYEISFVMPAVYSKKNLPEPNNKDVEIINQNFDMVACISFGGWATKSKVTDYHEKLSNWIYKEGFEASGKFMVAQYNSPWAIPPFRHNEIIVKIKE